MIVQLISTVLEHSYIQEMYGFTAHRLRCITPDFPKNKFPIHTTWNVQMQLKSTVSIKFCILTNSHMHWLYTDRIYIIMSLHTAL